jgi:hypothetical protein
MASVASRERFLRTVEVPYGRDFESFEAYDRLIDAIDQDSPSTMLVPVPEFECGIFLTMHWPGIPMSSHWSRDCGGDVGFLYFGDRFVVTEVSMSHSGGRVRGLVAKVDGSTGWISMYNTRSCHQFVVSMEGEPPWSRVRDLFPPLTGRALHVLSACGSASIDGGSAPIDGESLPVASSHSSSHEISMTLGWGDGSSLR